jgi:hypothetical protein
MTYKVGTSTGAIIGLRLSEATKKWGEGGRWLYCKTYKLS